MKINYIIGTLFLFLINLSISQAQSTDDIPESRRERVKALMVGYYTENLNLSVEEATTFWPVHNAYSGEIEKVRKEARQKQMEMRKGMAIRSDAELEGLLNEFIQLKEDEFKITRKYHEEFKKILPVRKVIMLYKIEGDFKKVLLNYIREFRENRLKERQNKFRRN